MGKKKRTPKRYVINIGVPRVSEKHYGSPFKFRVVRPSFEFFQKTFGELDDFEPPTGIIKRTETTAENLKNIIQNHSDKLIADDLMLITFTGHTFAIDSSDEKLTNHENGDRGWAMYDRIFFHFELRQLLQQFREGVKIVILTDSCYSDRLEARNYVDKYSRPAYANLSLLPPKRFEINTLFQKGNIRSNAIKNTALQLNIPLVDLTNKYKGQELASIVLNSLISEEETLALVQNVIKSEREESEKERQWFRDERNIEDYNKILIRSGKPTEQAIPPAVVIISASSRVDPTPSDLHRFGRSLFSICFEDALEINREKTNNLSTFFDDLSLLVQLYTLDLKWRDNSPGLLIKCPTELNNRIVPQWHYIQGHQKTDIIEFQLIKSNK